MSGQRPPDDRDTDPQPVDLMSLGGATDRPPRRPVIREAISALDRSPALARGAAAITALGLVVALTGWVVRSRDESTSTAETHGLTPDQAACFAYGRLERRVATVIDPRFTGDRSFVDDGLRDEVAGLGGLAGGYPSADDRLVAAFAAVADRTDEYTAARRGRADELAARSAAVDAAAQACVEVAGFDVDAMEPTSAS